MKKIFVSIFMIFVAAASLCFANTFQRAVKIVSKEGKKGSLKVYEVEHKSEQTGNILSTQIEYIIENSSNRILEGEFEFPLEDGESISSYALDINGKMRQGVAIEKEKGRTVFEDVVRKNIDPGLLEMTNGNNFKTRVYPIPAFGVRHIEVTIEKEVSGPGTYKNVFIQDAGRDSYFYFNAGLLNMDDKKFVPKPNNVTILFDVSGSAKNRDIEKELDFLKKYCQRYGLGKINFVTFANDIVDSYDLDFLNSNRTVEKIRNLKFDGATNLNVINKISRGTTILLFSDGLENWGKEKSEKKFDGRKIFTINSSSSANFSMLKQIAETNEGMFINLKEKSVDECISKIMEEPMRILSVEYDSSEINEVYPKPGTIVEESFSVAGVLKKKNGKIKISVGRGNTVEQILVKEISLTKSGNVESERVARLWAMKKINDLETDYDENKSEIIELAKKYTIVTKDTSLIVLDRVEDYVKYGIEPPSDLKNEYDRIVSRQFSSKSSSDGIPNYVYNNFEEFKKWWKKSPKEFKKEVSKGRDNEPRPLFSLSERSAVRTSDVSSVRASEVSDSYFEEERVYEAMGMQMDSFADVSAAPRLSESKEFSRANGSGNINGATVTLQAWSSNSDYIKILKRCDTNKMYEKYLELKKDYESSPAFFMEVSDYFKDEGLSKEAKRILSNLSEMNLENTDVLRALGNKLMEHEDYKNAIYIFAKLVKIKSEVPQFKRDLALAYEKNGDYQKAIDSLWEVASTDWDSRYKEIQMTALNDMNSIIANHRRLDTSKIDKKLMENFDVDLRIVLTWNTDDCDIDLWVTDPNNEKCYYGHKETLNGGRMSRDFTQGYGPEEFCLKVAPNGKYKIQCNYYGNHQQKLLQPVIVQAEVYTNFGRPNQTKQIMTLQLDDIKQTFLIGEIDARFH